MSIEAVVSALVNVPAITALVADRIALFMLPEGDNGQAPAMPALVWEPITGTPIEPIHAVDGGTLMKTRVQFTAISRDPADVIAIHAALRTALEFQSGVIAGVRVIAVLRELVGPWSGDFDSRVFEQPVDYVITWSDPSS